MKGLQEAVKGLKLTDTERIVELGRLAYRMGIEERANPRNSPTERNLWERGYKLEREKFSQLLARNGGNMR